MGAADYARSEAAPGLAAGAYSPRGAAGPGETAIGGPAGFDVRVVQVERGPLGPDPRYRREVVPRRRAGRRHSRELAYPHGSSAVTFSPCRDVMVMVQRKHRVDAPRGQETAVKIVVKVRTLTGRVRDCASAGST